MFDTNSSFDAAPQSSITVSVDITRLLVPSLLDQGIDFKVVVLADQSWKVTVRSWHREALNHEFERLLGWARSLPRT